jgi:hypothetical protein
MTRPDDHIRVTTKKARGRAGHEQTTAVDVDWSFPLGALGYVVRSSSRCNPTLPPKRWGSLSTAVHKRRLHWGGGTNGRVIYLYEQQTRSETVVAALTYHLQSNVELHVGTAGCDCNVVHREREFVLTLLACADGILRTLPGGPGALVWLVRKSDTDAARKVRDNYSFKQEGSTGGELRFVRPNS